MNGNCDTQLFFYSAWLREMSEPHDWKNMSLFKGAAKRLSKWKDTKFRWHWVYQLPCWLLLFSTKFRRNPVRRRRMESWRFIAVQRMSPRVQVPLQKQNSCTLSTWLVCILKEFGVLHALSRWLVLCKCKGFSEALWSRFVVKMFLHDQIFLQISCQTAFKRVDVPLCEQLYRTVVDAQSHAAG